MVRERLTGQTAPANAAKIVDLWRDTIEAKAGKNLEALVGLEHNQRAFGKAVRDLLTSLDMGDEQGRSDDDQDDDNSESQEQESPESGESPTARTRNPPKACRWTRPRRWPTRRRTAPRKPPRPRPPNSPTRTISAMRTMPASRGGRRASRRSARGRNTSPSPPSSTRSSTRRTSATRRSWTGCAPISTSSSPISARWWRGSPTACSAA